jgi:hypothetical protein
MSFNDVRRPPAAAILCKGDGHHKIAGIGDGQYLPSSFVAKNDPVLGGCGDPCGGRGLR